MGISENPGILFDSQDSFVDQNNDGQDTPIAVYNRPADHCAGGILFPIDNNPTKNLSKPLIDPYAWDDKADEVVWRGQLSGVTKSQCLPLSHDGPVNLWENIERDITKCLRVNYALKHGNKHNIKFSSFQTHKGWMKNSPRKELGMHNRDFLEKFISKHAHMIGDPIPFLDQLNYKYMLDLDGNNAPGSTISILKSNSVMLRPEAFWHTIIFMDLKPWVHYVPVEYDASDLDDKIKWCRDNDDECKQISARASRYINKFTLEVEQKIEMKIFQRLNNNSNK